MHVNFLFFTSVCCANRQKLVFNFWRSLLNKLITYFFPPHSDYSADDTIEMDGVTMENGIDAAKMQTKSLYLTDGIRSIDFVLAWQKSEHAGEEDLRSIKRQIFEQNLISEGLVLEYDLFDTIHCTKIHAPCEVLRRYSEILKLRLPMKSVCLVNHQFDKQMVW